MPHRYPLTAETWGAEEERAIREVLESGRFTLGERVRSFEDAFARRVGSRHAVFVNSGSSANLIAVAALTYRKERPLQRGDEVIVPAVAWATTYAPLQQHGLKLRVVDVDPETLNADAGAIEAACTDRTRAVVGVSVLGNPAPLDRIRALCDERGLAFLEDNCESLGARLEGRECGTFGDIGTFSTFYSHQISSMEGGIVVTDDDELHELALALRAHGWTRNLPRGTSLYEPRPDDFDEAYRFLLPGYNVRPLELTGAVALAQLSKLDGMLEQRRRNAEYFLSRFAGDPRFIVQRENGRSSWFCFTLILRPECGIPRARALMALKDAGIEFRMITGGNFLRHDSARHYDYSVAGGTSAPGADLVHDRGFFVGNFPVDARERIDLLREILDRAVPQP